MKKFVAVLVLAFVMFSVGAHAHPPVMPVPSPAVAGSGSGFGLTSMWPAVGFAELVMYFNATGVPFPACNVGGLKCYSEYPEQHDIHMEHVKYAAPEPRVITNDQRFRYQDATGVNPPKQIY